MELLGQAEEEPLPQETSSGHQGSIGSGRGHHSPGRQVLCNVSTSAYVEWERCHSRLPQLCPIHCWRNLGYCNDRQLVDVLTVVLTTEYGVLSDIDAATSEVVVALLPYLRHKNKIPLPRAMMLHSTIIGRLDTIERVRLPYCRILNPCIAVGHRLSSLREADDTVLFSRLISKPTITCEA